MFLQSDNDQEIARIQQKYAGRGFSEEDLQHCERVLGFQLPPIFRAYLSLGGKTGAGLSQDLSNDWPVGSDLLGAFDNAYLREIIAENPHGLQLPDDAFVIWWHEAYSFLFFRLSLGDTSPIFHYMEGDEPWWNAFKTIDVNLDAYMMQEAPLVWEDAKRIAAMNMLSDCLVRDVRSC